MFHYSPLFSLWAFQEECGSRRAPFVRLHSNEAQTAAAGTEQGPWQVAALASFVRSGIWMASGSSVHSDGMPGGTPWWTQTFFTHYF